MRLPLRVSETNSQHRHATLLHKIFAIAIGTQRYFVRAKCKWKKPFTFRFLGGGYKLNFGFHRFGEGSYDRFAAFTRQWKVDQLERVNSVSKSTGIAVGSKRMKHYPSSDQITDV